MIDFRPKQFAIMAAAFLAGTAAAGAQEDWFVFYPVTGEVALGFDGQWTQSNGAQTYRDITYEEKLRLQFGGYSLDPRIFNFSLFLEPVLSQERSGTPSLSEYSTGTVLNYNGRFSALQGVARSPVSLAGHFTGTDDQLDGDFGTRRDITTESRGLDLSWKFRPFPSTLSYLERSLDESFTQPVFVPGDQPMTVDREELQRTVRYRGRSSKMELYLEGIDFSGETRQNDPDLPPVPPAITDYQSGDARLSNFWRWGKGSSFTSRLTYLTRDGYNAYDRTTVDENLHLQHLENLYTSYAYSYQLMERTVRTETQRGNFELNHRYYTNLTTSFRLEGSATRSDQFRDDDYSGNLDFYYRKQFEPDIRVNANLGGGYRLSDQTGGPLDYTESQVVDAARLVILTQRFIIVSTIAVTAPGCNPCLEGTDYLVEDAGGDFTQLRIPVLSQINVGDTITVEYTYEPPTAKFYGIPYRVGFRVDKDWAGVYHRTSGETQHFISGPDPGVVGNLRTDTTGVDLRWTNDTTRLFASAERRYSTSVNFESTQYSFRQGAFRQLTPNLTINANVSESLVKDTNDSEVYNADVSVNWYPVRGLWINPFVSAFYRTVEPSTEERYWRAGVNTRWNWRRVGFELKYSHTDDVVDGNDRIEDRLMMNIRRQF